MQLKEATENNETCSYEVSFTGPIIGHNKVLGHFDCSLVYKVQHNEDKIKLSTIDYEADMVDSDDENYATNQVPNFSQIDFVLFY